MEINSLSNQSVIPGVLTLPSSAMTSQPQGAVVSPLAQQFAANPMFAAMFSMMDRLLSFAFAMVERLISPQSVADSSSGASSSIWESLKDIGSNLLSRAGKWLSDKFLSGGGIVGKLGSLVKGLF
jgi:hypothetical protein